jgi:gamma-glutamyltranspeptidase / glutathione hydrolase
MKLIIHVFAALALTFGAHPTFAKAAQDMGAVSSADPRATAAGEAILAQGGSAVDAAIAVMLALTVVEPQSSGIGGGGFMVRADAADGSIVTYDGRETAPAAATATRFLDADGKVLDRATRVFSSLSVGVPGNVALAAKAHAAHGTLAWAKLFEPAIALAEDGFIMNPRLHGSLANNKGRADKSAAARAVFYDSEGEPLPVGAVVKVPELAATFRALAAQGPEAMYGSAAATDLAAYVAGETPQDGRMAATDITGYTAKERAPVCAQYRVYRICGMGPPSSGGIAVAQMLGQLERFDLAAMGVQSAAFWHLFIESQRLAYADRELYAADADFIAVPAAGLIDKDYMASRSVLISPEARLAKPEAGTPPGAPLARGIGPAEPEHGTTHFAVVDASGNAVSYTSTVEGAFGSGLYHAGFYLNNELTDFTLTPEADGKPVANRVEGGKRPRSSMAPTIVFDESGKPVLVIGAAGGPTIPVTVARAIIGVLDFGLGAQEALAMPFAMSFGDTLLIEEGSALAGMQDEFTALGHTAIRLSPAPIKANAIGRRADGTWEVATEPRNIGLVTP